MTTIGAIRANIIAHLKTIPALADVDIREAASPNDAFALGLRGSGIFVSFVKLDAIGGAQQIGVRQTNCSTTWAIVCVATSYRSSSDAQSKALGLEELAEAVREIRNVQVGPPNQRYVSLRLDSEYIEEPPDRPPTGGPLACVCMYTSSPVTV